MPSLQLDLLAKDQASAAIKGMTGSVLSAGIALEALKKVAGFVIDTMKRGIEEFKQSEIGLKQLQQTVGGNISEFTNFAEQMAKVTTIEDDATIGIINYGLQLGIAQDKIKQASQDAIGLSKSFGVDLHASMKLVSMANQGQYTMLARYIPELRSATTEAEKHAIVQRKLADGFKLAQGEAETFSGKLAQLDNAQGEILESVGKIVSVIGKDLVSSMLDGANAINDFLSNSNNIATMGASFEVIKKTILDFGKTNLDNIMKSFSKIAEDLKTLATNGSEAGIQFQLLSGALKLLSIAANVSIQLIALLITPFVGLVKVIKEVIEVAQAFWDAVSGKKSWGEVWKNIKDVGKVYADTYADMGKRTKNLITETVKDFASLPEDIKNSAKDLQETYKTTFEKIKTNLEKEDLTAPPINTKNLDSSLNKAQMSFKQASDQIYTDWKDSFDKMSKVEKMNEIVGKVKEFGGMIASVITDALALAKEAWQQYYEEQFAMLDEWSESHLSQVDDWMASEMEKQGVQEETKQEQLQREISTLQGKLNKETDLEKKTDLQQQINEKQDDLARQKILDEGEKKKNKISEDAKKKETALKKKQFEENKAFQIAMIWVNAATSIMGWWASFASLGIPGIVLAAVMSAATLVMAGVQTGIVASQTFHAQEGGLITKGATSGDNTMLFANKGEAVFQDETYKNLVNKINGENNSSTPIYIENFYSYSNNADQLRTELIELARTEAARG